MKAQVVPGLSFAKKAALTIAGLAVLAVPVVVGIANAPAILAQSSSDVPQWQTTSGSKMAKDGGGCHGALWQDGKLWIVALRLRGILRVDPATWQPEFLIPFHQSQDRMRVHGIAWDNGAIWQIVGNDSNNYAEGRPGLVKYDAATGKVLEVVDFLPHSSDPHGLAMHNGTLISCDAGIHPGWPNGDSPTSGWIFRIDFV